MTNHQRRKFQVNPKTSRVHRTGFTLIEVLVTVGIIVVLTSMVLAGVLIARKRGIEIRVHSDLSLIGTALEAYKDDNGGQYPVFADPLADVAGDANHIGGNGSWLDRDSYGVRGAALLCRALLGPGPAAVDGTVIASPGDDGADGPGYRIRRNFNTATGQYTGKVYGPYLDASKFKIEYVNPPGTYFSKYPKEYPVIFEGNCGDWVDTGNNPSTSFSGSPVLYYPANPGTPTSNVGPNGNVGFVDLGGLTGTITSNVLPRFNRYDNFYFFPQPSDFETLAAQCGSPPYLLWTAGADGAFGLVNGKSDDITNFDLPANLRK